MIPTPTVVVGMSGGVDSSVAAALLQERGHAVIGITMKTYAFDEVGGNLGNETSCCGLDAFNDARQVAVKLGIPHYVVDFTRQFEKNVIDNFVMEYSQGRTPNPCVICNRVIKWGELLEKARSLGAEKLATGHYARVRFNEATGRYSVHRAAYRVKDQSYALWGLGQEALSRTIFPLGELTKPEVRSIASRLGLKTANKDESFEICFVADNDYRRFVEERIPASSWKTEDPKIMYEGKVVGSHSGFPFYTIGQRSGIGAFGERMYVTEIDARTNTLTIGKDTDLLRNVLTASQVNFLGIESLPEPMEVEAQVRYKDTATHAMISPLDDGIVRVEFSEPKRAITPGQSVVFYRGDELLGGGVID
ncbi:MAG TPA: tRNA 2-thiouridine(34) synthase MnmA [Bacteroidota bacterium]|nr:tRNA 2-thiouridine(34) synthase MnmA [Bacteroidota bacterium]